MSVISYALETGDWKNCWETLSDQFYVLIAKKQERWGRRFASLEWPADYEEFQSKTTQEKHPFYWVAMAHTCLYNAMTTWYAFEEACAAGKLDDVTAAIGLLAESYLNQFDNWSMYDCPPET